MIGTFDNFCSMFHVLDMIDMLEFVFSRYLEACQCVPDSAMTQSVGGTMPFHKKVLFSFIRPSFILINCRQVNVKIKSLIDN